MSAHTSYGIGGPADIFAEPEDIADLRNLIAWARVNEMPVFILGAGRNILVSDRGIRGIVARLGAGFKSINICGSEVVSGASAGLGLLVKRSLDAGLTGLEGLAGIPGNIGGAVFMNAGTPHGCIGDYLTSVKALDAENNLVDVPASDLGLRYRGSDIDKSGLIILEATFSLPSGDTSDAKRIVEGLLEKRRRTQPVGTRTAGSVFKNPDGDFAGRILEKSGAKGMEAGGARVSDRHANFIENTGSASAQDVRELILHLQQLAKETCGVDLEPEVRLVGEWRVEHD
jgi:UDP-N-acetylmuramate dehydrogenase